jgi:hypothetical protein
MAASVLGCTEVACARAPPLPLASRGGGRRSAACVRIAGTPSPLAKAASRPCQCLPNGDSHVPCLRVTVSTSRLACLCFGRVWSAVYGLAWLVGCSFEQFGCLGAACGLAGGVQIAPPSLAPEERKQNSFLAGLARGGRKGGSW